MNTAYKFLRTGLKSNHDGSAWKMKVWRTVSAPERECVGLNASKYIQDALQYVQGEILALIEYNGTTIETSDKITCEKMRIVKRWAWTKQDSIKLAIFCAELSLPIWKKKYPNDKRPQEAIKAAKAYLKNPSQKNKNAAAAAYAAYAAAAYAANAAAYAANAAAYSAANAAYAANAAVAVAYAAVAVAYAAANAAAYAAAAYAAAYAAREEMKAKIHAYILRMKNIDARKAGRT